MRGARRSHLSNVSRNKPTVREADVDDAEAALEESYGVGAVDDDVRNDVDGNEGTVEKAQRPGCR